MSDLLERAAVGADTLRTLLSQHTAEYRWLRSDDGDVAIQVDACGTLRAIDIAPDWATRRSPAQLATAINRLLAHATIAQRGC